VQYIDCDVEEPNGHIFLKPQMSETLAVAIDTPKVDAEKCDGCGKCGQLCQYSAILCLNGTVMTFEQLCHSCGGCMLVCPTGAITVKQRQIGFVDLGSANGVKFAQGRLDIGDIHTPGLIKHVRQHAAKQGCVIIDAPPGTSCPVIEAVKGADFVLLVTEPTPFGLNDLRLAVGMVRELKLPFAVAINRSDLGDDQVRRYCDQENIEIVLEIPDDRRIAEVYSVGEMVIEALPGYRRKFAHFCERLKMTEGQI
jgi:MinD superfamily P-loop ATPase